MGIDAGAVPAKNIRKAHKLLGYSHSYDAIKAKSVAAANLYTWLINTIAYYDRAAPIEERPSVSEAPPSVKIVAEASKYLCKADIVEIKSLSAPPKPVMMFCICVCILLGRDCNSGWAGAREMIADACFLKILLERKKEDVTIEQVEKVREILHGEQLLDGNKVKSVSKATYGLLRWVLTMINAE